MRRGGLLIVLGLVLAIGAAAIILMTMMQQQPPPPQPPPGVPEAQPTGVPTQKVWVALQPIRRGGEFVEGTLGLRDWPTTNVPPDVIGDAAETIGRVAAIDIVQGMPILRSMLAEKGAAGQAALQVPPGRVAVAFPIDEQSSVAYAIQPGDYVDVLIMASFIDLDPEFQTKRPNYVQFFTSRTDKETGETSFNLMDRTEEGRFERPPGLPPEISGAIVYPREEQRPRRVAQLTVQAAKVLRVGPRSRRQNRPRQVVRKVKVHSRSHLLRPESSRWRLIHRMRWCCFGRASPKCIWNWRCGHRAMRTHGINRRQSPFSICWHVSKSRCHLS